MVSTLLTQLNRKFSIDNVDIGACMQVLVKKWGNSASVRIPAAVMNAAKLRLDQPVDIREEAGRIIIEPIRTREFDLTELLAGITDENKHDEIDFGPPLGKEAL